MKLNFCLILFIFIFLFQEGWPHQVVFETARPDQAPLLTKLSMDSNAHWGYRNAPPKIVDQVLTVTKEYFKNQTIRVMKENNEVIGFFCLRKQQSSNSKKINELSFFFLKPDRIGKGYGKILFQEAVRVAKEELGWQAMMWESDPFAAGFYRKMGATEIGSNICPLNQKYRSPLFVVVFN